MLVLLLQIYTFANLGHRACGDITDIPENTIASLEYCLSGEKGYAIQDDPDFTYLEFDIQETYDGHLVLFHDKRLGRNFKRKDNEEVIEAIENNKEIRRRIGRKPVFKRLKIEDLTLNEIQSLYLRGPGKEVVPSLEEFFFAAKTLDLRKPLILEIKKITSETAWENLLTMMQDMHFNYMLKKEIVIEEDFDFPQVTTFLSFKSSLKRSFGKWKGDFHQGICQQIEDMGLSGIYRPMFHSRNYCDF